jgi:hypothetical protein
MSAKPPTPHADRLRSHLASCEECAEPLCCEYGIKLLKASLEEYGRQHGAVKS